MVATTEYSLGLKRICCKKASAMTSLIIIFLLLIFNNLYANENSERNEITKNLRCLICQGQSVYDSDSDFANSMKILVDKKLDQGLSEKEIYIYFKVPLSLIAFLIFVADIF